VVMPGHIGTEIVNNSRQILSGGAVDVASARKFMTAQGINTSQMSDAQIGLLVEGMGNAFRDNAPTSAAEAAKIILDGVKAERWRILVGKDAELLDRSVRADPENAYTQEFYEAFTSGSGWRI